MNKENKINKTKEYLNFAIKSLPNKNEFSHVRKHIKIAIDFLNKNERKETRKNIEKTNLEKWHEKIQSVSSNPLSPAQTLNLIDSMIEKTSQEIKQKNETHVQTVFND